MDRLRPRGRRLFSGFTKLEVEKMEKVLKESGEQALNPDFCKRLTGGFNRSSGRAGKPAIKWIEVQSWFQDRLQECTHKVSCPPNVSKELCVLPETFPSNKLHESSQMPEVEYRRHACLTLFSIEFTSQVMIMEILASHSEKKGLLPLVASLHQELLSGKTVGANVGVGCEVSVKTL